MAIRNPVTPLSPVEAKFVAQLNATMTRPQVLAELKSNLQTAIEIELATIPIYLYTYYSLVRNTQSGEQLNANQAFANKAGAAIMSVAVEEMLHMSLSSNVLHAMGQSPQLYGRAPKSYPTPLPFHNPKGPKGPGGGTAVKIPLAKLGFEQLWHFLQIEYPEQWDAFPQDRKWNTIGQFYSYIRCLISTKFITDSDFQQGAKVSAIQPFNYSPNNVDTIYPKGKFDPWKPAAPVPTPPWAQKDKFPGGSAAALYTDADDSHAGPTQLVAVASRHDALVAIDTICDQGEGNPVWGVGPSPYDDPTKREFSHYYKFLTLQAQFDKYSPTAETLPKQPIPPPQQQPVVTSAALQKAGYLINFPDNPTTASYPGALQTISQFSSALFQYMLIMTETIYRVPPAQQKRFFNEGLHRSMIWVMDKYFRTIRQIPLFPNQSDGPMMAPVFENIQLSVQKGYADAYKNLTGIGALAITSANAILNDPKQPPSVKGPMADVIYYIQVATPQPNSPVDQTMLLPDVAPYWR